MRKHCGLLFFLFITILYLCNYILFPYCIGKRIFIGDLKNYCYNEIDLDTKEDYFVDEWKLSCWEKIDSIFSYRTKGHLWTIERVYLSVDKKYVDGVCEIEQAKMSYDFGDYKVLSDPVNIYPIRLVYDQIYKCEDRKAFEQTVNSLGLDDKAIMDEIVNINEKYKQALVQLSINEYHKAIKKWNRRLVIIMIIWGIYFVALIIKKIDQWYTKKEQDEAMSPYL